MTKALFRTFPYLALILLLFFINCGQTPEDVQPNPEDVQKELRELGINYNETSFLETVEKGDNVATRLFLKGGMNPNTTTDLGLSALMVAAQNGHLVVMETLLAGGADIAYRTDNGETLLQRAATTGQTRVVKYLVDQHHTDANAADNDGYTPLMSAALWGYLNTVKALLERGADPKLKTKKGGTALDRALQYKKLVDLGLKDDGRESGVDELIELLK